VRLAACEAWGRQPGGQGLPQLVQVLADDQEAEVRLAAARELGRLKDARALVPLTEALADANPALQHGAAESLRAISGRDYGDDVQAWRQYAATGQAPEPNVSLAERLRRLF
jgi:HEAT repeat protein